jgi:hypothetical protein
VLEVSLIDDRRRFRLCDVVLDRDLDEVDIVEDVRTHRLPPSVRAVYLQKEIRGAKTWTKGAITFLQLARSVQRRAVGFVWAPRGRLSRVLSFTITHGKIVQVDVIADPARLHELDLAVLKGDVARWL